MRVWQRKIGNFLFRVRSFTPIPPLLLIVFAWPPRNTTSWNPFFYAGGIILAIFGELIRILVVGHAPSGTSGRENYLRAESLNTAGLYAVVRNPLYWGNLLIFSGLFLAYINGTAILVGTAFLFLQYHFIIKAEEHYLAEQYGEQYRQYCRDVSRWLPRLSRFRRQALPCNWKQVLFKENDSVFNAISGFYFIFKYREWRFSGKITITILEICLLAMVILAYAAIKWCKKR